MSRIDAEELYSDVNVKMEKEDDLKEGPNLHNFKKELVLVHEIKKKIKTEDSDCEENCLLTSCVENEVNAEIASDEEDISICDRNSSVRNGSQTILNSPIQSQTKPVEVKILKEKCLCPFHAEDVRVLDPYNCTTTYKCTMEDDQVTTRQTDQQHEHTGVPPQKKLSYDLEFQETLPEDPEQFVPSYKCPFCVYQTPNKFAMTEHYKGCHGIVRPIRTYRCHTCPFKATKWGVLMKHVSRRHKEAITYRCDLCKYETRRKATLRNHQKIHEIASVRTEYKSVMGIF